MKIAPSRFAIDDQKARAGVPERPLAHVGDAGEVGDPFGPRTQASPMASRSTWGSVKSIPTKRVFSMGSPSRGTRGP
jgi:hypothetical protein